MNAHPKTTALAAGPIAETPTSPPPPDFAKSLMRAAEQLFMHFKAGKPIDAKMLRAAMEAAFGSSDAQGAWIWKDAYDAAEVAQIMMLSRYGAVMQHHATSPAAYLSMIERLAALAPSHTRRSEDSVRLQQMA